MFLRSMIFGVLMSSSAAFSGQSEQEKLDALLAQVTRVVVMKDSSKVLFASAAPDDLRALKEAVRLVDDGEQAVCMCMGDAPIHLYAGKKKVGELSNQHGSSVRFTGGEYDGRLLNPELWLAWYERRGVPGPRLAWNESKARAEENAREQLAWLGAMPASLKPFWPRMRAAASSGSDFEGLPELKAALANEGDEKTQIRAVLRWYAAGAGPWSGYPSWEGAAERLLLGFESRALVAAVESTQEERVLDGAARLFSSWDFGQQRRADLKALPAELKTRLLTRALASSIQDNRDRARNALGTPVEKR